MTMPLLETLAISKSFGATQALDGVTLTLFPGEVLALVGENGAGKSTLMKILAGVESPDTGAIVLSGVKHYGYDVREALGRGIVLIHQELNLAGNLSIAENIYLGREPASRGVVRRRELFARTKEILARVGLDASPRAIVDSLSIAQQQQVEIGRALSMDAKVIIFDEPTSSLTLQETARLFELIRDLKARGLGIIYISHRLAEVKEIAQRVTILRDGKNAGSLIGREITHDAMASLMVGRDLSNAYPRVERTPGSPVLTVKDLVTLPHRTPISIEVRRGEVVGIGGLVGSGRTELLTGLFGVAPALSGTVLVDGAPVELNKPAAAVAAGIALVSESRKDTGLILQHSIAENITLASIRKGRKLLLNRFTEARDAESLQDKLSIKAASVSQAVSELSGGNQQKVVLAKWLATNPKVLLLDEPTRGIDVGAKREIYELLFSLASSGLGILFVSSDMEELLGIADRIYVMHDGAIAGELARAEFSEKRVVSLATRAAEAGAPESAEESRV